MEERGFNWTNTQVESGVNGITQWIDRLPVQDIYRRNVCINGYIDRYRSNTYIPYGFVFYKYYVANITKYNNSSSYNNYGTSSSIALFVFDKTVLRFTIQREIAYDTAAAYPITTCNVKFNTFYSVFDFYNILLSSDNYSPEWNIYTMDFTSIYLYDGNINGQGKVNLYFSMGRLYTFNFISWSMSWYYNYSKTQYSSYTLFTDLIYYLITKKDVGGCSNIMYFDVTLSLKANIITINNAGERWFPLFTPSNLYLFNNPYTKISDYEVYNINTKQYVSSCNWLFEFQRTDLVQTWFGNHRMLMNILFASYLTGSTSSAAMDIVYTSGLILLPNDSSPVIQKTTLKPLMTGDGVSVLYGINLNHIPTFYVLNKGADGNTDVLMTQEGSEYIEYYFTTRDMTKDYIYAFNYTGGKSNLYMFESAMKWQMGTDKIVAPTAFTITNISSQSPWNGLSLASGEYIYAIHANADFSNIIVYTAINEKNGTTLVIVNDTTTNHAQVPAPYNIAKIKGMYFFGRTGSGAYKRISNAGIVGCSAFLSSLTSHYLFQMAFTDRHPINKKKDFLIQQTGNVFGSVTNHHAVVTFDKIKLINIYHSQIEEIDTPFDNSKICTIWDVKFAEPTNTQG